MAKTFVNDASGNLFNTIRADYNLSSDRKLAQALEVAPPVISKIRSGKLAVGATMILKAHEELGYPVKKIRELLTEKPTVAAAQEAAEAVAA